MNPGAKSQGKVWSVTADSFAREDQKPPGQAQGAPQHRCCSFWKPQWEAIRRGRKRCWPHLLRKTEMGAKIKIKFRKQQINHNSEV